MKQALVIGVALMLAPIVSHAQMNPPTATPTLVLPTTTAPANAGKLSPVDGSFLTSAAIGGMAEVEAGQLAMQHGDAGVQAVGKRMVADHTKADDELTAIAKSKGFELPKQVDPTHAAAIAQLRLAHGSAFDNQYLNGQIADHQKAIAVFQQEVDQGSGPELKAFAVKTLPMLQEHLAMVKDAIQHGGSSHTPS